MGETTFQPGDVVVVTGAAQGIGRAIAVRLACSGARLSLWNLQDEAAEEAAALCRDAGAKAQASRVDVADWPQVQAAAHELRLRCGAPCFPAGQGCRLYYRTGYRRERQRDHDPMSGVMRRDFAGKNCSQRGP